MWRQTLAEELLPIFIIHPCGVALRRPGKRGRLGDMVTLCVCLCAALVCARGARRCGRPALQRTPALLCHHARHGASAATTVETMVRCPISHRFFTGIHVLHKHYVHTQSLHPITERSHHWDNMILFRGYVIVCECVIGRSRVSQPLDLRLCLLRLQHFGFLTSSRAIKTRSRQPT